MVVYGKVREPVLYAPVLTDNTCEIDLTASNVDVIIDEM